MKTQIFAVTLSAIVGLVWSTAALAEKRVALVIGNGSYAHAPRLPNPKNDAEDVAGALKRIGFDTILGIDFDKGRMEEVAIRFAREARNADVALFYYSGHALQFGGVNYLVPVDAQLNDEADLRRMVRVDEVVVDLQQARNLRILILDSCRDNPLAEGLRRSIGATRAVPLSRGLARIDGAHGMIVSYATQAGRKAEDGSGRNSPYTGAFLRHIEAQEEIGTIFRRVSTDVYEATRRTQLPELSLSLIGEFFLNGKAGTDPVRQPGSVASIPAPGLSLPKQKPSGLPKIGPLTEAEERSLKPRETFSECANCPEMTVVAPGTFLMGSPVAEPNRSENEGPQRQVNVRGFAVGTFSITFEQWDSCVSAGGCGGYQPADQGWGRGKRPVINVSWDDAKLFVEWLSVETGKTYRLLTEAEREYIARGGTQSVFSTGPSISTQDANFNGYEYGKLGSKVPFQTTPVGTFKPNALGVYDVHGNVFEWTEDCWHPTYDGAPTDASAWKTYDRTGYWEAPTPGKPWTQKWESSGCDERVVRGGSWFSYYFNLRSAARSKASVFSRESKIGFRVARTLSN